MPEGSFGRGAFCQLPGSCGERLVKVTLGAVRLPVAVAGKRAQKLVMLACPMHSSDSAPNKSVNQAGDRFRVSYDELQCVQCDEEMQEKLRHTMRTGRGSALVDTEEIACQW